MAFDHFNSTLVRTGQRMTGGCLESGLYRLFTHVQEKLNHLSNLSIAIESKLPFAVIYRD